MFIGNGAIRCQLHRQVLRNYLVSVEIHTQLVLTIILFLYPIVATPWTTPNHARAQRTVVIGNVNECQIKRNVGVGKSCPELVAMCDVDAGAQCVDEIGTYSCKCPEGTEGDGFLPIAQLKPSHGGGYSGLTVPMNYRGGTGCRDTSRPVIEILGPNPKTLRVAKVSGLEGDYKMKQSDDETSIKIDSLRGERRNYYENEIKVSSQVCQAL